MKLTTSCATNFSQLTNKDAFVLVSTVNFHPLLVVTKITVGAGWIYVFQVNMAWVH